MSEEIVPIHCPFRIDNTVCTCGHTDLIERTERIDAVSSAHQRTKVRLNPDQDPRKLLLNNDTLFESNEELLKLYHQLFFLCNKVSRFRKFLAFLGFYVSY